MNAEKWLARALDSFPDDIRVGRRQLMITFICYFYMWIPMMNGPYDTFDFQYLGLIYKKKIQKKLMGSWISPL